MISTAPLTPEAGVKFSVPSAFRLTLPWAGLASTGLLTVSWAAVLSTSVSLALTSMFSKGTFKGVVAVSATATGMSLVPLTVTVSVVSLNSPAASRTR